MTGRCSNCGAQYVTVIKVRFVVNPGALWDYCSPCYEAGLVSGNIVPAILV